MTDCKKDKEFFSLSLTQPYIRQYEEESWFMIFNFQEKSQKIKIPERLRNEKMNLLMSNYNKNDQEIMKPYEGRIYILNQYI